MGSSASEEGFTPPPAWLLLYAAPPLPAALNPPTPAPYWHALEPQLLSYTPLPPISHFHPSTWLLLYEVLLATWVAKEDDM